jgi:glycosyltransferase involved in cell wall biosynthesis
MYIQPRMTLKFCISVPVGGYHPFLERCLCSLATQIENDKGYELTIAFLDASGDDRVKEIADKFDFILSYRRHAPDGGQSAAILEGWEACPGDILGWLNADDILFPDALSNAAAVFASNNAVDVVYGHSTIVDENFRTRGYHWAVEPPGPRLLEAGIISQPSCFFRRSAYERAGGLNRDLHYTMDWDLWIRMFKSGAKFKFIDQTLSMVLWAEATKTASFNKLRRREIDAILNDNLDATSKRRVFRSFAIHHFLEKLRPEALKRFVFRALIRGRNTINGISGDGKMHDGASIIMAHYASEPKNAIIIEVDDASAITRIACPDNEIASWSRPGDRLYVIFRKPINAGNSAKLIFSTNQTKSLHMHWAAWR